MKETRSIYTTQHVCYMVYFYLFVNFIFSNFEMSKQNGGNRESFRKQHTCVYECEYVWAQKTQKLHSKYLLIDAIDGAKVQIFSSSCYLRYV